MRKIILIFGLLIYIQIFGQNNYITQKDFVPNGNNLLKVEIPINNKIRVLIFVIVVYLCGVLICCRITENGFAKAGLRNPEISINTKQSKNHFRFFKLTKK